MKSVDSLKLDVPTISHFFAYLHNLSLLGHLVCCICGILDLHKHCMCHTSFSLDGSHDQLPPPESRSCPDDGHPRRPTYGTHHSFCPARRNERQSGCHSKGTHSAVVFNSLLTGLIVLFLLTSYTDWPAL